MQSGSLVQIHYHNRIGGVTTVMAAYARAFAVNVGSGAAKRVVCHDCGSGVLEEAGCRVTSIADCDYRLFRSRNAFEKVRTRLRCALEGVLADSSLRRPIRFVGHNLNLGKNCALSAAFADIAAAMTSRVVPRIQ